MLTKREIQSLQRRMATVDDVQPRMLRALGDRCRFRIFTLLMERHDLCVTDVAAILHVSVPAASQQLRLLEHTGLIRRMRMGQMVCYEIVTRNPIVRAILKIPNH